MNTDYKVPPPPSNLPAWSGDLKATAEEKNWDKEGKLRGQEEQPLALAMGIRFCGIPLFTCLCTSLSWLTCFMGGSLPLSW